MTFGIVMLYLKFVYHFLVFGQNFLLLSPFRLLVFLGFHNLLLWLIFDT